MTNLIEQLRACPECCCAEAADEIERLRSLADDMGQTNIMNQIEIERLQERLHVVLAYVEELRAEIALVSK